MPTSGRATMTRPNQHKPPSFGALVQSFFADYLTQQRGLSTRTVAAYRDAFLLFLELRVGRDSCKTQQKQA